MELQIPENFIALKQNADIEQIPLFIVDSTGSVSYCNESAILRYELNESSNIVIYDVMKDYADAKEVFARVLTSARAEKIKYVRIKENCICDITLIPDKENLCVLLKEDSQNTEGKTMPLLKKKDILGYLIAGICNNFNNNLGAIQGNASLLIGIADKIGDKTAREDLHLYLGLIDKSVSNASELVSQLNSFASKISVSFKDIDVNEVIKKIYLEYLSTLEPEIQIDAEVLPDKAMAKVDSVLLENAIRDVCENAYHAMTIMSKGKAEKNGGVLTISLDHQITDKQFKTFFPKSIKSTYWAITISDTGVGMNKEEQKKAFYPFYSSCKDSLNPDGLGLSMANCAVRAMGGFMDLQSEVNKGTTVTIYIPEDRNSRKPQGAENFKSNLISRPDKAPSLDVIGMSRLILVADDDIIMRRVAEVVMEKSGYKVIVASDGEEALEIYKTKWPDIGGVFLDNSMPKLSGIDAFYEMKKINPTIKALLISGNDAESEEVKTALSNGMKGFVKKPYTMADLQRKVRELFEV